MVFKIELDMHWRMKIAIIRIAHRYFETDTIQHIQVVIIDIPISQSIRYHKILRNVITCFPINCRIFLDTVEVFLVFSINSTWVYLFSLFEGVDIASKILLWIRSNYLFFN